MSHTMDWFRENRESAISLMEQTVYPGNKRDEVALAYDYCMAMDINPLQKLVHLWEQKFKLQGKEFKKHVVLPGIGLYRVIATRTGRAAGCDAPVFGPVKSMTSKWRDEDTGETGESVFEYPEWCEVTVYRMVDGIRCPYTSREYWLENYATGKGSKSPNTMWRKRAYGQIAKCAEAQSWRKGFQEVGSMPTFEEMEGKDGSDILDQVDSPREPRSADDITMPKGRSELAQIPPAEQPPADQPEQPGTVETGQTDRPADRPAHSGKPLTSGMIGIIRAELKRADRSEADLCEAFSIASLDGGDASVVNEMIAWAKGK